MVFSSLMFVFFFLPIVTIIYYLLVRQKVLKNLWLFGSSIFFYFIGGGAEHTILLLNCIIFNYLMALLIESAKRKSKSLSKIVLIITILYDLGVLGYYKYCSFFISQLVDFCGSLYKGSAIVLPIGISFYIFQTISYVVDVYRGEQAEKNPFNVGLYISFFPQLVAGPIVRFHNISKALHTRKETCYDVSEGLIRFIVGFNKKVLLANTLGELADLIFNSGGKSLCMAWLGILAYALQIFYDFSGYSDMAIGLGRMFGFHFTENFNYPYIAKTITDFWRRWHISLSTFFRDYLYIPLGGAKVKVSRHILNLAIVWTATGIWHGANWTFLIWGVAYFVLLTLEKYVFKPEKYEKKMARVLYRIFTLLSILILWVVFRSNSVQEAVGYIKIMFGSGNNGVLDKAVVYQLKNYMFFLVVGIVGVIPFTRNRIMRVVLNKNIVKLGGTLILLILFCVAIAQLMIGSYNPFIYFMF